MITLNQLSMAYGQRLLFYDVNLILNSKKRYALVGSNGAGKSTFFRLITGEEEATSGSLNIPKSASIGWLKQDQFRHENTPIIDVVLQGKPKLWQALQDKEALLSCDDWTEAMGYKLSEIEEIIAHNDGYSADGYAAMILEGLGIAEASHQLPLHTLSGGFKLRVLLAQVLFQQPAILLLDEPTNHLDILSIAWLETFLKNEFKGLVLFISHDVVFIDKLADAILDLDYGEVNQYHGNYEKFLAAKALMEEQKRLEVDTIERRIAVLQKFVEKNKARASKAKQAQSRVKQIEKIDIPDVKKSSRIAPHFSFSSARRSGKKALSVENVSKQFQDKTLFEGFDLEVMRNEKIAIMGVNGAGKSTLIKMLASLMLSDEGEITYGHEVQLGYVSQDHHEQLNKHQDVLSWLSEYTSGCTEQTVRKVLGQLLFSGDDVKNDVLALSGGEAARLLLAKEILASPNLLLLDEPTNHMDIETTEALAKALVSYDGTLIFISHNRFFVSAIATRFIYFSKEKGIIDYKGIYKDFEQEILNA